MHFRSERSGLAETRTDVTVLAVDAGGRVLYAAGDPEEPFYYRSAIKPLQAAVVVETGLDVAAEHLAVMCSSHSGFPAHIAIARQILDSAGLDVSALATPPAWPFTGEARRLAVSRGVRRPQPIFHNCSGKHAGWLAACRHADLPTAGYVTPDHPLQQRAMALVAETTGRDVTHLGIDGCGAPTPAGTAHGLATAFSRLSVDDRFARVVTAMERYPALVADSSRADGLFARWWHGPAKCGAEGVMAATRRGIAIVAKAWSGSDAVAVAAVAQVAWRLGMLERAAATALEPVLHPVVFGGGKPVGTLTLR